MVCLALITMIPMQLPCSLSPRHWQSLMLGPLGIFNSILGAVRFGVVMATCFLIAGVGDNDGITECLADGVLRGAPGGLKSSLFGHIIAFSMYINYPSETSWKRI